MAAITTSKTKLDNIPDVPEDLSFGQFHWMQKVKEFCESMSISTSTTATATSNFPPLGWIQRPRFVYKDTDEIYINAGAIEIDGEYCYWSAQLTYQFSSLGTSDFSYLYVNTGSSGELTASDFSDSTTEPTWDDAVHAWTDGSGNRCVFAVWSNGSDQIEPFTHDGDTVCYDDRGNVSNLWLNTPSGSWTDMDCTNKIPSFCTKFIGAWRWAAASGTAATHYWRVKGSSALGHYLTTNPATNYQHYHAVMFETNDSQVFQIYPSNGGAGSYTGIYFQHWYLPIGM